MEDYYNCWLADMPLGIETQVVIQPLEGEPDFGVAFTRYSRSGEPIELMGRYGWKSEHIKAYMRIPTLDIDRTEWHGDYIDEQEPEPGKRYLVTTEERPNCYRLRAAWFLKDKWQGVENVVGWREFPKTKTGGYRRKGVPVFRG